MGKKLKILPFIENAVNNANLMSARCRQPRSLRIFEVDEAFVDSETSGTVTVNPFDAIICGMTVLAIIMGINSGLLRSLATIVGYIAAMPIAVIISPQVSQFVADQLHI